jgi:hypothetical protein
MRGALVISTFPVPGKMNLLFFCNTQHLGRRQRSGAQHGVALSGAG